MCVSTLLLRVGYAAIITSPAIKYLGVLVDCKITFWRQILYTADKPARMTANLGRLMTNVGGPSSNRWRLLMTAIQSIVLYGSDVWADALRKELYCKILAALQRRAALRDTSAYRKLSQPAILIVAGVIPVILLAKEKKCDYTNKRDTGEDRSSRERAMGERAGQLD